MNNQKQESPYEVNDVVNNLIDTNAKLTFENAELKAIIQKIERNQKEQAEQIQPQE